ncbi:hypothetical protein PMIN01_02818 [Paraphaeosphaeria minitans]|uniref:Uncharacterized protein n=1 Tax=Paraphaeosphaeria minitans TaxID=565426 RepID=A0A9P6KUR2_9PLEO|nr:hypothetical protein PMIN01_02818 [Paraphaeosphaeria minitans]
MFIMLFYKGGRCGASSAVCQLPSVACDSRLDMWGSSDYLPIQSTKHGIVLQLLGTIHAQ